MAKTRDYEVALIRGGPEDESGPETMDAALAVLEPLLADTPGLSFKFIEVEGGAHCVKTYGKALPDKSFDKVRSLGVVFKAPTAGSKISPQAPGISLTLRKGLDTYANITPCKAYRGVAKALHPDIDMVMVRENTEGLFEAPFFQPVPSVGCTVRVISLSASERVAQIAFQMARERKKRLTVCVVPPRAIKSEAIFLEACMSVSKDFADVEMEVRKPDSLNALILEHPEYYDVIVAPNDWGFILSDLMVATTGSVGLGSRANLGEKTGLFEPIHGTAPGKANRGTVNPVGQILSGKLMLSWLGSQYKDARLLQLAQRLERAVKEVLDDGKTLTVDLGGTATTRQIASAILERARS